jgi:hypothetical protein
VSKPIAEAIYHLLQYNDISEAAGFVAVLTRFLSNPQGSKYLRPAAPAEVWSYVVGSAMDVERVDIYMNASAYAAVKELFVRAPLTKKVRGDDLQMDCVLLIGAGGVEAWGVEEAQWHMMSER